MQFGIRKLFLFTTIIAVICALFVAARNSYYAERIQIQSILAGVKGISDISLYPYIDGVEEINRTSLKVDRVPASIISFGRFGGYHKTGRFAVGRIGKWTFRVHGRRHGIVFDTKTGESMESEYIGNHIMFGPGSPYSQLFPFELNTVQDLVDHYEEIVDALATWPSQAAPGSVILEDGSRQYYSAAEDPLAK